MPVHGEGDFKLGADSIGAGNQHGLAEFFGIKRKEPAKTANLAQHFAAMGGSEQPGQVGFDPISQININPGGGVSFLSHAGGTLPASVKSDKRRVGLSGPFDIFITATDCYLLRRNSLEYSPSCSC
jgi:hypothetical protein